MLHQCDFKHVFQVFLGRVSVCLRWTIHNDSGTITLMALEAWERLGELLVARRVELGFPNRTKFAKAKGLKDTRILAAVENVERQNFEAATIALMEHTYEWAPGSIRSVLAGGEPTPKSKPDLVFAVRGDIETSVGGDDDDDASTATIKARKPPGMSDEDFRRLLRDHEEELQWKLDRAAKQR